MKYRSFILPSYTGEIRRISPIIHNTYVNYEKYNLAVFSKNESRIVAVKMTHYTIRYNPDRITEMELRPGPDWVNRINNDTDWNGLVYFSLNSKRRNRTMYTFKIGPERLHVIGLEQSKTGPKIIIYLIEYGDSFRTKRTAEEPHQTLKSSARVCRWSILK